MSMNSLIQEWGGWIEVTYQIHHLGSINDCCRNVDIAVAKKKIQTKLAIIFFCKHTLCVQR